LYTSYIIYICRPHLDRTARVRSEHAVGPHDLLRVRGGVRVRGRSWGTVRIRVGLGLGLGLGVSVRCRVRGRGRGEG
jgi:hypothetical protein